LADAYSIRESLQGALQDFVRESGIACVHTEGLIREIVSMLASYREEDVPLFPEVFIFASPEGPKALAPSSQQTTVGTLPLEAESSAAILKNCAPLAKGGWSIFVVKENQEFRYGLFRSMLHSLSTAAEESMGDLGKGIPVILIRNRGHFVVDLRSTTNDQFTATLTTTPAEPSPLEKHVESFSKVACSGVKDPSVFQSYLRRLLTGILQECHGALLAVIQPPGKGKPHASLKDGVWPTPFIALSDLHARARSTRTSDALADLIAAETLLRGMVNSDGVVVFGSDGSIRAYHVFLKPSSDERGKLSEEGGGRRRAYDLMRQRLKSTFKAVLIRSQDGDMKCEVSK
jgi:hypothetical protein